MDFTIQSALIPVEQGYETVDVQISDGRIAAIAPSLESMGTAVDGRDKLLLPGFVNAHTHSSEMWQRGMIPPRRWNYGLRSYMNLSHSTQSNST